MKDPQIENLRPKVQNHYQVPSALITMSLLKKFKKKKKKNGVKET